MLREKINSRLDDLEQLMDAQKHLTNPSIVIESIDSITKFWSILSDEEKDFLEGVRFALSKKLEWKHD
jgi:hypothetical protein